MDLYSLGTALPPCMVDHARLLADAVGCTPSQLAGILARSAIAAFWLALGCRMFEALVSERRRIGTEGRRRSR